MEKRKITNGFWYVFPVLGTVFCIVYILAATRDVVYSDYIRLVNSYLPDVWNPEKFFVADVLVRIPVNYLGRIVNVMLFGYSTTFDMVLGALSLGASAAVLSVYCREKRIGTLWYLLLMVMLFSLNKWEMLTNGTGWCHFLAFWGFYYHYLILDRVWGRQCREGEAALTDEEERRDRRERRCLCVLPWVLTLGAAGPYCGAYSAVLLLMYGICFFLDRQKKKKADFRFLVYGLHVILPLVLYLISNACTVQEYAGATGRDIGQVVGDNAGLFPRFLLKSFSSMVVGEEVLMDFLQKLNRGMALCYLAGVLVLGAYLLALWMQVRYRLYRVSVLPLMFIFWGGLNHLLVLAARWIFENSSYGMSSRYALQYQVGILGIFLTFALASRVNCEETGKKERKKRAQAKRGEQKAVWQLRRLERTAALLIAVVFCMGNVWTSVKEVQKAKYRKEYAQQVEEMALHYRDVPDDELEARFQYRHGPERIRRALGILEEQGWNVFRE